MSAGRYLLNHNNSQINSASPNNIKTAANNEVVNTVKYHKKGNDKDDHSQTFTSQAHL